HIFYRRKFQLLKQFAAHSHSFPPCTSICYDLHLPQNDGPRLGASMSGLGLAPETVIRSRQILSMRDSALSNALVESFTHCPQYARLLARTARATTGQLNIAGLTDSAKSLVLSVLIQEIKRPIVLVVPDNHLGARFQLELLNLTRFPVLFFPASEVS